MGIDDGALRRIGMVKISELAGCLRVFDGFFDFAFDEIGDNFIRLLINQNILEGRAELQSAPLPSFLVEALALIRWRFMGTPV